tara:strand:- start:396 stop:884 length:489 start_codon:yes stop_codon:yes gene_type:complete
MPWQRADSAEKIKRKGEGHIPISRCSSVVALSLGGNPIRKLRNPARKAKTQHGFVYDPWAPWQVLNIQCYPDHKHSMDSHDSTKHYVNGPEAFLHTLLAEFRDAQKRFRDIQKKITNLVIPPVRTSDHYVIQNLQAHENYRKAAKLCYEIETKANLTGRFHV